MSTHVWVYTRMGATWIYAYEYTRGRALRGYTRMGATWIHAYEYTRGRALRGYTRLGPRVNGRAPARKGVDLCEQNKYAIGGLHHTKFIYIRPINHPLERGMMMTTTNGILGRLVYRTDAAYMYDCYGDERWIENIAELIKAGYLDDAIEWVMWSKIPRWADDAGTTIFEYIRTRIGEVLVRTWMRDHPMTHLGNLPIDISE